MVVMTKTRTLAGQFCSGDAREPSIRVMMKGRKATAVFKVSGQRGRGRVKNEWNARGEGTKKDVQYALLVSSAGHF